MSSKWGALAACHMQMQRDSVHCNLPDLTESVLILAKVAFVYCIGSSDERTSKKYFTDFV